MHIPGGALPLLFTLSAVTAALPSNHEEQGVSAVKRSAHAVVDLGSGDTAHAKRHASGKKHKCHKKKPKNQNQGSQQPQHGTEKPAGDNSNNQGHNNPSPAPPAGNSTSNAAANTPNYPIGQDEPPQKQQPQKQQQPYQQQPAKQSPYQQKAPQQTPAQQTPAQQTPAQQTPAQQTPAQQTPAQQTPAQQTPAQYTPAQEKPSQQTPYQEKPAPEKSEPKQAEEPPPKKASTASTGPGCPADLVNVCFNGVQNQGTSDRFADWGATSWLTPMGITEAPIKGAQIPMCAYENDIDTTVEMISKPDAPEYFLTFNEPDHSYQGRTATMSPAAAAQAFQKLKDAIDGLKAKGTLKTKFIAPAPADMKSTWLDDFFTACDCKDYFHAYNVHVYTPELDSATGQIEAFHQSHDDKPVWVTEIAPGQANPSCSVSWDQAAKYMRGVFHWGKVNNDWVERIFWNSGNQIENDINVCNSYLLDKLGGASQLLNDFKSIDCS